jgi:hypothetical protein
MTHLVKHGPSYNNFSHERAITMINMFSREVIAPLQRRRCGVTIVLPIVAYQGAEIMLHLFSNEDS